MKRWILSVFLVFTMTSAKADSFILASSLGNLLASEKLCNLTFNPQAIAKYIEKNVAADDMQFAGNLQLMTNGSAFQLKELSAAGKVAHCTQSKRVAKANGFLN